jgi:hypothetical protein
MWIFKLFLALLAFGIICQVLIYGIEFIFAGKKSFDGFRKGVRRYSLSSSIVSLTVAGLCLMVQAPIFVTLVAFFASFIGTTFILLGNDEDNDQFRKL